MKHLFCNALVHVIYSVVSGQYHIQYNVVDNWLYIHIVHKILFIEVIEMLLFIAFKLSQCHEQVSYMTDKKYVR